MGVFETVAFPLIIGLEGPYSHDPQDPGGETKFGISKAAYPKLNIANLTLADAEAIYLRDYWTPIGGDRLRPRLALLLFDAAVNQGVGCAAHVLQVAVGTVTDGIIGPATLKAAAQLDQKTLFTEIVAQRMVRYAQLANFSTFGLGWSRRLANVAYVALTQLSE